MGDNNFICDICSHEVKCFTDIINHAVNLHAQNEIVIKKRVALGLQILRYRVIPEICTKQGRYISINEERETIRISRVQSSSPLKKKSKVNTENCPIVDPPESDDESDDDAIGKDLSDVCDQQYPDMDVEQDEDIARISEMLPRVVDKLKECGHFDEYLSFHELLATDQFPIRNIAYLLFLDVVRWFSLTGHANSMRYSDEVKLFWKTGLRLFRGKFLRFMGGPKHLGQITEGSSQPGFLLPNKSKINFVVPDRRSLTQETNTIDVNTPGIIHAMIDCVSHHDIDQVKTYKVCVDGKKINPSSRGEIDLWGCEEGATHEARKQRLQNETQAITSIQSKLNHATDLGHTYLHDLTDDSKTDLVNDLRYIIQISSGRIRDLREKRVGQQNTCDMLLNKCEGDWRNSKYSLAISSLRTCLYQVDNCIDDLLSCIDKVGQTIASLKDVQTLYSNNQVQMGCQENYSCLSTNTSHTNNPNDIKQRSDRWFEIRAGAFVTGSVINKAVGLEGLKKQRELLKQEPKAKNIPDDVKKKMEYGTVNEIHAVSTVVGKILPVFYPNCTCFEEGCYIIEEDGNKLLVVSPDGSVRCNNDLNVAHIGLEIKCPFPGKTHTTPVQYEIPVYYVPQILSEMYVLSVSHLLFVSYSKESTSVLHASFDDHLWQDIMGELQRLKKDGIPKKTPEIVHKLRNAIKGYVKTKVKFIAEFPSTTATECNHEESSSHSGRYFHSGKSLETLPFRVRDLQRTCQRIQSLLNHAHTISAKKASEVLVFLVSDLDRQYDAEIYHSNPIAYGLKGYSMTTDSMRKMLKMVLFELYQKGMYTPVVSYDGQWAALAVRSSDGKPLTLLQLQRDVYNEVKKRSKASLTSEIFNTCTVRCNTPTDQNGVIMESIRGKQYLSSFCGHPFETSTSILTMLARHSSGVDAQDPIDTFPDLDQTGVDHIFSSLNEEAVTSLDQETTDDLQEINETVAKSRHDDALYSNHRSEVFCEDLRTYVLDDANDSRYLLPGLDSLNTFVETLQDEEVESSDNLDVFQNGFLGSCDAEAMLDALKKSENGRKWSCMNTQQFAQRLVDKGEAVRFFTKADLRICFTVLKPKLKEKKIAHAMSWTKLRLITILHTLFYNDDPSSLQVKTNRRRRNPPLLSRLCKQTINKFPKVILNCIVAEHTFPGRMKEWSLTSPFSSPTTIEDLGELVWYSQPEFNDSTMAYVFATLDVHHLLTNCRIKVCKDGMKVRGIRREAWVEVAKTKSTNLCVSHVEDLVDKQSDSIARETFSKEVEAVMNDLNFTKEAQFCKLFREFIEGEDEPGISAKQRCQRRLNLREWMLKDVNFGIFPPYGMYVKDIPYVMFEGIMTNIERRIQLFPFVKSGSFNVRSLGSLEAENLFGSFQDLDPKGSGVIKAEEVPAALNTACELLRTRLDKDRCFHMATTRAKVYPLKDLSTQLQTNQAGVFINPSEVISTITPRNHHFDLDERAARRPKRKRVGVAGPLEPGRGVAPVRQHHRCDESKIMAHKRLGLELHN